MARESVSGYCWPQSVDPGSEVGLHLSATTGTVDVEVARMGRSREVVFRATDLGVAEQAVPADASTHGCGWPATLTLDVGDDWETGYYEVLLTGTGSGRTVTDRAFVVVRPPATSERTILLVLGTNTWHAYNDWGGTNLYNGGTQVSLQRPMAAGYLHKPPGLGRRVASVHPPDPKIAARIGRRVPAGSGGYTVHRPEHWLFEGTDLEYGDLLGAAATVVGYECDGCDFTYRDGLPYPTGTDGTPESFEILGTSPAASFTAETAARPPKPGHLSELEFHAWRLFGSHDRAATDRLANGHAVLGTYTRGGTVVTSGCTDWAMGLAERDPQVEQVTRNLLDRLGR